VSSPPSPTVPADQGVLAGWVRSTDGSPLTDALVLAEAVGGAPGQFELVRTDGDGWFELQVTPGDYRLRAEAPGHETRWYDGALDRSSATAVHAAPGASPATVVILLPPEAATPAPTMSAWNAGTTATGAVAAGGLAAGPVCRACGRFGPALRVLVSSADTSPLRAIGCRSG